MGAPAEEDIGHTVLGLHVQCHCANVVSRAMRMPRYDLIVIGSGPAGERGAELAAKAGKRVAVIEKAPDPGGAAVHTGTLPSKTLRETALYLTGYRNRELYGVSVKLDDPGAAVPHLIARKDEIAAAESARIRSDLAAHGVDYHHGRARFVAPETVELSAGGATRRMQAKNFLIATGSRPYRPEGIDFNHPCIHDSDGILRLAHLPRSMLVLGGGVIGCEYACMFASLGVKVTVIDARDEILPFLDDEVVRRLKLAMNHLDIEFIQGRRWHKVRKDGQRFLRVMLADGSSARAETLLFAAGRTGQTHDLGLELLGIETDGRSNIPVDENFQSRCPGVYAAGDVIGFPALASVSMEQARVAMSHAFGLGQKQQVSPLLPYGIYTIPEVSSVGETEQGARARGLDIVVGEALYRDNARGRITGDLEGVTKLVVERETRALVGCHVIGERASELVHIGLAVMKLQGTIDVFVDMVFNYPTLSESFKYAAYDAIARLDSADIPEAASKTG